MFLSLVAQSRSLFSGGCMANIHIPIYKCGNMVKNQDRNVGCFSNVHAFFISQDIY